jgi:hypothetical protein
MYGAGMWLVFCPTTDLSALWAYEGLRSMGLAPLELITAEALAYSRVWEHRVSTYGVSVKIGLSDGRLVSSDSVRGVLNRLVSLPPAAVNQSVPADREYVTQEMMAFWLSWLHALRGPVLNRPTPLGLSGRWRHLSEWVMLANRAGLQTPVYRQSSHDPIELGYGRLFPWDQSVSSVIVLGENVFGPAVPDEVARCCCRLAKLCETEVLGIDFHVGPQQQWFFAGATPVPDLTVGGQALLKALAATMRDGCSQL